MMINETESPITGIIIEQIKEESNRFQVLGAEVSKVIVGQEETITFILLAILCKGHILLEGVPGVAKTTMIKAVTKSFEGLTFSRIQFTPDLLPSDLVGTLIYNQKDQDFQTKKGPIFANLILADEINRAPAKVQAALLEAMQERQVTIGSSTYTLDDPFLVFATQNPVEQEGTYRLPEAQIDRFMFKLIVGYPLKHHEREIIKRDVNNITANPVLKKQDIYAAQELVKAIFIDDKIIDYIVSLVFATRMPLSEPRLKDIARYIQHGASPRATLALYHAAKAHAFIKRRHYVTPDDVKAVAAPILRHRIIVTYEAEADGISSDMIVHKILTTIPVP